MSINTKSALVCWLGTADLKAVEKLEDVGVGPVVQAVKARTFDHVYLLSDYGPKKTQGYLSWLCAHSDAIIEVRYVSLTSPVAFGEIYEAARRVVSEVISELGEKTQLTFHLSPGTWAMAAVWFILAKTRFPAELLQSSRNTGAQTAEIPFNISADFLPDLLAQRDAELRDRALLRTPQAPEFDQILHRTDVMARTIARARRVAVRNVPVLIEGESGTGKELFARAIHRASLRGEGPFIAVNCGAIPKELIESELFGHEKGAFTGAQKRKGHFRAAHRGTLFLDEVGELPRAAQVKLLRVLQEHEVVPVGSSKAVKVDVRIICATHRNIFQEAAEERFRSDLLYRLAVAILILPALRERQGDIALLARAFLNEINEENADQPGYEPRTLTANAINALKAHFWPGNVRELHNTLQRAALWSETSSIGDRDVRDALVSGRRIGQSSILDRPLEHDFNLEELLGVVVRHYLGRALEQTGGNKTRAAELVGLGSRQTLNNWLVKYGVVAEEHSPLLDGAQK